MRQPVNRKAQRLDKTGRLGSNILQKLMSNLVGLHAERLLTHPHGAAAVVVAVDRLFAKLRRNPNDGWRATVGSVPDSSVVCQPQHKRKRCT